jgi:hypothetical protein
MRHSWCVCTPDGAGDDTQANDDLTKEIEDLKGVSGPTGGPGRPGLDGEPGVYTAVSQNLSWQN